MFRSALSAFAIAGFLAASNPVLADPVSDQAKVEVSVAGQAASPAPASTPGSSSQPANVEPANDVPVGIGWG